MPELTWIEPQDEADRDYRLERFGSDPHFLVGDVGFRCGFDPPRGGLFSIQKDPRRIQGYLEMVDQFRGENFVELGIAFGGSVALAVLVAPSAKLVAVDLKSDRVEPLDQLIAERGLGDRVRLYYGVDQRDREH